MSEEMIATILAALLPIALTALITWLERRGQEARQHSAMDMAYKRIQFLNIYLTTQQLILPPEHYDTLKQAIGTEIEHIFQELTKVLNNIERMTHHTHERNVIQRIFLLYRMHTMRAKLFRGLFYALLSISTIVSILFTIGITINQNSNIITATAGISIVLLPFVLLALLFRWLALHHEQRTYESTTTVV
jgi:cytochrome bd-type quinol oxidase subunit 2